jgi:hypothetical protein
MIKRKPIFGVIIACSSIASANEPMLEFEAGYVVNGQSELQPSGLAVCDGKMVFVSDKHENEIYQLTLDQEGVATAETWKTIADIPEPPKQKFEWWMEIKRFLAELFGFSGGADWEGIACDDKGNVFLASEYYFSVLKIDASGKKEWLVDNLYKKGYEEGLFQKDNAYVEGVTANDGGLLLAAEREPRGFVSVNDGSMTFYVQPGPQLSAESLPYDFTGLDIYHQKIIVLERNHYKVCEISKEYGENMCYTFKDIAMSVEWGYKTGKYGLAEGLAVVGDSLWIIVDNNGDTRKANPDDTRSTILKFKNPF